MSVPSHLHNKAKTKSNWIKRNKKYNFISNTPQSLQIKIQQQRSNLRKLKLQQQKTQLMKLNGISLGASNIVCPQARKQVKMITEFLLLKTVFCLYQKISITKLRQKKFAFKPKSRGREWTEYNSFYMWVRFHLWYHDAPNNLPILKQQDSKRYLAAPPL